VRSLIVTIRLIVSHIRQTRADVGHPRERLQRNKTASGGDLGEAMLMRIADDEGDAFEGGDFLRSTLRVTSGDQNTGRGIDAMHTANGGTRILIGGGGYGAGVEDDDFGFGSRVGSQQSVPGQLTLDRCAIGLSSATTEVFYIETSHESII
jgi:hypothetical protein